MRNHLVQYVYFNIDDFTVHNQSFILRYSCSKDPMPGSNQQKKSTLLGTNIYHLYIYIYIDIPRWRKENHLQKWFLMGYVSCQEGISVVYKLCSAATSGEVNFEVLHSWRSQEQAIFWHQDCWATKKKPPTFHHTGYYFIDILIMVYFNPHIYIYNWVGKSPVYPKQPGLFSMLSSRHAIVTVIHDPTEAWVLHGTMNLFGGDTLEEDGSNCALTTLLQWKMAQVYQRNVLILRRVTSPRRPWNLRHRY